VVCIQNLCIWRLYAAQVCPLRIFLSSAFLILCWLILETCGTSGAAFAQTSRAGISGRVVDAAGALLRAARVEVQPGGEVNFTTIKASFSFGDLPPGEYTVTVSYVGFAPFTTSVKVAQGQTARLDAPMKVGNRDRASPGFGRPCRGEARRSIANAQSDNILQVLPVEVITSLPNTNIADALGRLPSVTLERDEGEGKYVQIRGLEPRLANVTIDGRKRAIPAVDVRQIKLDIIPANLVDSVEINKTLSANQDGDAIAGSVNLVTKTAGEEADTLPQRHRGYTPIVGGRSLYELDGDGRQTFSLRQATGHHFWGKP